MERQESVAALQAGIGLALALILACAQPTRAGDVQVVHPVTDVCSLLSERTASIVLGGHFVTATPDPASQCEWAAVTPASIGVASVLTVIEWPGPTEAARLAQLPSFGVPSQNAQRIKTLPAAAIWALLDVPEYSDHVLVVLSGGLKMSIFVKGTWADSEQASAAQLEAALRVAKEVLLDMP